MPGRWAIERCRSSTRFVRGAHHQIPTLPRHLPPQLKVQQEPAQTSKAEPWRAKRAPIVTPKPTRRSPQPEPQSVGVGGFTVSRSRPIGIPTDLHIHYSPRHETGILSAPCPCVSSRPGQLIEGSRCPSKEVQQSPTGCHSAPVPRGGHSARSSSGELCSISTALVTVAGRAVISRLASANGIGLASSQTGGFSAMLHVTRLPRAAAR
jgi:hypothetical protein